MKFLRGSKSTEHFFLFYRIGIVSVLIGELILASLESNSTDAPYCPIILQLYYNTPVEDPASTKVSAIAEIS